MKYWMFQNNQVKGPYDPDDISQVPGFGAESLVCSEGRKGTNMGDWQRASQVPELSVALLKASQLAVASVGKGGFYPGLPPEPTLKDLAQLGSLQERVALLDGTISQLQESLRLKENDLLSLHRALDEKNRQAGEMALKLGTLEERLGAINQLQANLDKTAAVEHELEGTMAKQSQIISDLTGQIQSLQAESAQLKTESAQLKTDSESLKAESEQLKAKEVEEVAELKSQIEELKNRPAPAPSAPEPKKISDFPEPIPFKSDVTPLSGGAAPIGGGLTPLSEGLQPAAGEKLTPLMEPKPTPIGLGEPSAPVGLGAPPSPAPVGLGAPIAPVGLGEPPSPLPAGPMPFSPLSSPAPMGFDAPPPAATPTPSAPAPGFAPVADAAVTAPPKKGGLPKPLLAIVVILGLGGAFAVKKGLIPLGNKPAPVEQKPVPPPPPPEPPKGPTPEEIAEQHKKDAIELVRSWPVPGSTKTLGQFLEGQAADAGAVPWTAEAIKDDLYQVNFYPKPSGGTMYEFQADTTAKKVIAHNEPAAAILTPKEKKVKRPKIKAKAKKTAANQDGGMLGDLLSVPSDDEGNGGGPVSEGTPAKPAKNSKPRNVNKEVDDLLGGDSAPPKASAKKKKDESLDDLLVPGGGSAGDIQEPQASPDASAPPPPPKKAPKKAAKSGAKPADAELLDDLLNP